MFFKKKSQSDLPKVNIPNKALIIGVDFDGTCVEHRYPEIGKDMPGAAKTLRALAMRDHKLVLWTCREDNPDEAEENYLSQAIQWFEVHEIPLYGINEVPLESDFRKKGGRKPPFDLLIDDTSFGGLSSWPVIHYTLTGMPLI